MKDTTTNQGPTTLLAEEDSVAGRVALVTGGTRGIGAATSRGLAGHGAVVAAGYSSEVERAEAFLCTLDPDRTAATIHKGNVGVPDDCVRVVQEVMDRHGRLDILVNNAGVTVDRPVLAMTVDDWHQVLRVNLSGAFYLSKPVLAHMLERGSGRIINISSIVAETGNIGQANYAASSPASSGSPSRSHAKRPSPWIRPAGSSTASASPSTP